jgi:hypothetical protein
VLLESVVLTGSQASVELTNLTSKYASTYQHLQIRAAVRGTGGGNLRMFLMQFNGDTAANYMSHALYSDGPGSIADGTKTSMWWSYGPTGGSPTNAFGAIVTDILDPFEITKNTTIKSLGGGPNGYNMVNLVSGHWRNTNSLTSITLTAQAGDSYAAGTRISLYGIRGTA